MTHTRWRPSSFACLTCLENDQTLILHGMRVAPVDVVQCALHGMCAQRCHRARAAVATPPCSHPLSTVAYALTLVLLMSANNIKDQTTPRWSSRRSEILAADGLTGKCGLIPGQCGLKDLFMGVVTPVCGCHACRWRRAPEAFFCVRLARLGDWPPAVNNSSPRCSRP